jgi:hypothetical protein
MSSTWQILVSGTKWKARTNFASVGGVNHQHFSWVAWRKDALHAKSQKQTLEDLGPENNSSFGFKHLPIKFSHSSRYGFLIINLLSTKWEPCLIFIRSRQNLVKISSLTRITKMKRKTLGWLIEFSHFTGCCVRDVGAWQMGIVPVSSRSVLEAYAAD